MNKDYELIVPETSKDLIQQPEMAKQGVLPKLHFSMLLVGSSGSGKSVLAFNLIKQFYKDCFDLVVLISPTGDTDDIQAALEIPKSRVISDMKKAEESLQKIMDVQTEEIKKKGFEKCKNVLVYLDDVVADNDFMSSDTMVKAFIRNRHYKFSVLLCSQYWKAIPRRMRMQSAFNVFFECSETELKVIADDFEPPGVSKKKFISTLTSILSEKFQFVSVAKRSPWSERFRKGLAQVIHWNDEPQEISTNGKTKRKYTKRKKEITQEEPIQEETIQEESLQLENDKKQKI